MANEPAWKKGLDLLNDVEGAPNRAVMAGLSGGNPVDAFLHGDKTEEVTHRFVSKALGGYDVSKLPPPAQFALDFVAQTLTDPVTYIPGADIISLGIKLPKLLRAIKVLQGFKNIPGMSKLLDRVGPVVEHFQTGAQQGHALRSAMGATAERNTSRNIIREQARHDQRSEQYSQLVDKYGKFMDKTGNVPMKVRGELQRLLWHEGSKEVRNQLVHDGFRPSTEERAAPILNLVRRYDKNYLPDQSLRPPAPPKVGEVLRVTPGKPRMESPHNTPKYAPNVTDPLSGRVLDRLQGGSRDVRTHGAAVTSMRDLGLLGRKVNTPRGPRYTNDTLNERTQMAQQRADAALQSGDTRRLSKYITLIEKQKKLAGGSDAVPVNIGNRMISPEQATRQASSALQNAGVKGRSLATTADGGLKSRTARTPLVNALQKAQMTATATGKLGTRARMGAADTQAAASKYGLAAQQRVEGATDKLKTRQVIADQALVQKLLKARAKSGDVKAPLRNAVADIRDAQAVKGGAEYQGVKDAARGRNIKSITRPSSVVAKRADALADRTKNQMFTAATNVDKADTRNAFIDANKQLSDEMLKNKNTVYMPDALRKQLYPDDARVKFPLMQGVAQAGRDAMFFTSIPHKVNLAGFALGHAKGNAAPFSALAEGVGTILKGSKYATQIKQGTPEGKAIEDELINIGAPVKYSRNASAANDQGPLYTKFLGPAGRAFANRADKSSAALHQFETGLRYAELQKLKKRGVTDPTEQGGELRDMYGNPYQVAPMVRAAQDVFGAEFPNYRLGTVPRAAAKMLTQSPRGVHNSLNSLQDFNYDVSEPVFGGDIRPGGNPLSNYGEMINPASALDYAGSPASVGPVSTLARSRGKNAVGKIAGTALQTLVPASRNIMDLIRAKDHKALRAILSTGGWDLDSNTKRAPYYPADYQPR
jgi:hypothetical protein